MNNIKKNLVSYTSNGDTVRIEYKSENCFVIYLNKFYLKETQFQNKIDLELYFKSLFLKLKKYYGITMEGFYTIDVYKDPFYGMILKIQKEDFDYFEYDTIDMKLRVKEATLLYRLEEEFLLKKFISYGSFYKEKQYFYYQLEKNVPAHLLGILEEMTTLIPDSREILEHAKKINTETILTML